MIREPDPGNVRGREPTAGTGPDDGQRASAPPALHLTTHQPGDPAPTDPAPTDPAPRTAASVAETTRIARNAATPPDEPPPDESPPDPRAPDESATTSADTELEPVVDLRPADGPVVSAARIGGSAPSPARRSTDPAEGASAPTLPPTVERAAAANTPAVARHSGLADRAIAVAAVPVVVLLVTLVATSVLLVSARSAADAESQLARDAASRLESRVALDELNAAVLASVAVGVGQAVTSPDELARRSDAARVSIDAAAGSSADDAVDGVAATAAAADDAALAYVDAVDEAVDRTGSDPLELGNELTALDESFALAASTSNDAVDALDAAAADHASTATRRTTWGLGVALLGALLSAASVVLARVRLAGQLDRPVRGLRSAVARIGAERPAVASVLQGPEELVVLGTEIDAAARSVADRLDVLERRAAWGERSRMILEALELADDEPGAYEVIGEALGIVGGRHRGELLLSERGTSRLTSVAASTEAGGPGCPVDVISGCVALRRGQVSVFDSSETINACPKLRGRPYGNCSAVCVPVTVAGRQLGVLHVTGDDGAPPGPEVVEQLVGLSSLVGNRLGSLRTLESTRHEASTDGLTGLPNRRTLEAEVAELIEASTPFVMVLADLDKFKRLNDNFGHEVGDKALQLFAGVLRDNVRGNDVVARLGGEEFVLVYPNMSVEISIEAIDRLRGALARAVASSRIPPFTCSFGIAHSSVGGDGDVILRVADAGLLRAKELGGDRAVVADEALVADVFDDEQD